MTSHEKFSSHLSPSRLAVGLERRSCSASGCLASPQGVGLHAFICEKMAGGFPVPVCNMAHMNAGVCGLKFCCTKEVVQLPTPDRVWR
ncbi:hypothetical protein FM102_00055 [Corynebacterium glutamicum]|nr:hypothetical protein FM102_00055 [Corynebacterium glutamicum]